MPADVLILTSRPQEAALWRAELLMRGYGVTVRPFGSATWVGETEDAAAGVVVLDTGAIEEIRLEDVRRLRALDAAAPCIVVVAPVRSRHACRFWTRARTPVCCRWWAPAN